MVHSFTAYPVLLSNSQYFICAYVLDMMCMSAKVGLKITIPANQVTSGTHYDSTLTTVTDQTQIQMKTMQVQLVT